MSTYIVGDIQGCYDELIALLDLAHFDENKDELWVTGDLVARGPKSLETLRFIKGLGNSAKVILGNHDLHLLAISEGIRQIKEKDQLITLLDATDSKELLTWLRKQPLFLRNPDHNFVMVHAGVSPQWTINQAAGYAREIEKILQGPDFNKLLAIMYGNTPASWSDSLIGDQRLRFIINVFTRMRFCFLDGSLELKNKCSPKENKNCKLKPWFEIESLDKSSDIVFGHWAALMGISSEKSVYALDTGCVWGNSLTMLRWQDKKIFSQPCLVP
ncbi:MAG: symmetrical bis(5'-nucleosyl)-tetraphosphatase [Psychromonas sp.]|nr:symmetrical bis(5'-nucleosyl)-tetraphosphatase [Psychromonas sp.]